MRRTVNSLICHNNKGGDVGNVNRNKRKSTIFNLIDFNSAYIQTLGVLKSGYQTAHPIFIISFFLYFSIY